jgi:hypothetical protein
MEQRQLRTWISACDVCVRCQLCRVTSCEIWRCCVLCHRTICTICAGVAATWICQLVQCRGCITGWAQRDVLIRDQATERLRDMYVGDMQKVLRDAARAGTATTNLRGLKEWTGFARDMRLDPVPASIINLSLWMTWAVLHRAPRLDTSSIENYLGGVGTWHVQAAFITGFDIINPTRDPIVTRLKTALGKLYKLPSKAKNPFEPSVWLRAMHVGFDLATRLGLHGQLLQLVLTAGPLRAVATAGIHVHYSVFQNSMGIWKVRYLENSTIKVLQTPDIPDMHIEIDLTIDKNVDARNARIVYIPHIFMGMDCIKMLEHYLISVRPPCGKLFRCPKGGGGAGQGRVGPTVPLCAAGAFAPEHTFWGGDYTAHCNMVRRAYKKAFPLAVDAMGFGGGSPRKSLAEWLWSVDTYRRVIADVGGWSVRTDAVDMYFKTRPKQLHRILSDLSFKLISVQGCTRAQLQGTHG